MALLEQFTEDRRLYRMNGVLTVISAASEERVQSSFLNDRSLSKCLLHIQVNLTLLSVCNRRSVRPVATEWLQTHFLVTGTCQDIFTLSHLIYV